VLQHESLSTLSADIYSDSVDVWRFLRSLKQVFRHWSDLLSAAPMTQIVDHSIWPYRHRAAASREPTV